MRRLRDYAGKAALAGLATLLTLGLLEITARVILSARPPGKSGEQLGYTQFDPELGWKNRPGAAVTYRRREYETDVRINALGFRDVERPLAPPADRPRILVLGDSFVEAYAVGLEEGLTRRLESLTVASGCAADVVNAGVHGYSTDQEALWYARHGADFGAAVVVIAPYYNDIVHNVRDRYSGAPKPVLETRDGALVPTNVPIAEPPPRTVKAAAPRAVEGSALRALIVERLLTGAPQWYARLAAEGLVDDYEPEALSDEFRVYRKGNRNPQIEAAWTRTAEILDALAGLIRARGARPVMLHVPARLEVSDRAFELTLVRYGLDRSAWEPARVRDRMAEIASASGFAFVDPTADLRAGVGLMGEPYFPVDGHWNRSGNDIAARALFRALRERGALPCAKMAP